MIVRPADLFHSTNSALTQTNKEALGVIFSELFKRKCLCKHLSRSETMRLSSKQISNALCMAWLATD